MLMIRTWSSGHVTKVPLALHYRGQGDDQPEGFFQPLLGVPRDDIDDLPNGIHHLVVQILVHATGEQCP